MSIHNKVQCPNCSYEASDEVELRVHQSVECIERSSDSLQDELEDATTTTAAAAAVSDNATTSQSVPSAAPSTTTNTSTSPSPRPSSSSASTNSGTISTAMLSILKDDLQSIAEDVQEMEGNSFEEWSDMKRQLSAMNRRIEDHQHRDQRRVAKVQARLQQSMRQLETMMMLEGATATTATTATTTTTTTTATTDSATATTVQSQQTVSSTLPRGQALTTRSHLPGESSSSTAATGRVPTITSKRDTSTVTQSINDLQRPSRHLDTSDMESVHAYLEEILNVTLIDIGCPYHLLQQLQQHQPYNNHAAATCNFNGRAVSVVAWWDTRRDAAHSNRMYVKFQETLNFVLCAPCIWATRTTWPGSKCCLGKLLVIIEHHVQQFLVCLSNIKCFVQLLIYFLEVLHQ